MNEIEYRREVAAVAVELDALARMGVPLAVRAEHAALVWVVERCGGVVDLLTADVEWMPAQVVTVREEVAA